MATTSAPIRSGPACLGCLRSTATTSWSCLVPVAGCRILRRDCSSSGDGRKPSRSGKVEAVSLTATLKAARSTAGPPRVGTLFSSRKMLLKGPSASGRAGAANVAGVAPELAVCGGSHLERPQCLHSLVGLPEESQAEGTHDDDEEGRAHERDEQFDVDARRHAADGPDERVVGGARAAGASRRRLPCPDAARAPAPSAQIFSSDVLPTKFVISHLPSIFATSRLPAVIAATFPVSTSMK